VCLSETAWREFCALNSIDRGPETSAREGTFDITKRVKAGHIVALPHCPLPAGDLYEILQRWEENPTTPIGARWEPINKPSCAELARAQNMPAVAAQLALGTKTFSNAQLRKLTTVPVKSDTVVRVAKSTRPDDADLYFRPTRGYRLVSAEVSGGIQPLAVAHASYAGNYVFSSDADMRLKFLAGEPASRAKRRVRAQYRLGATSVARARAGERKQTRGGGIAKKPPGAWWTDATIRKRFPYMLLARDWLPPSRLPQLGFRLRKASTSSTLSVASFRHD